MVNQIKRLKNKLQSTRDRLLKILAVQLIYRTAHEAGNHDATQRAAGVAYFAILSIFPLLLGLTALFGFFLPSLNLQSDLLTFVGNNLPGATDVLKQNIVTTVQLRSIMGMLSVIIFFWSGSTMFSSVSLVINRAWNIRKYRHFLIRKAGDMVMAISTGILFFLSLGASAVTSILSGLFGLPAAKLMLVNVSSRLMAFLLILAVFLLLYKLVPNTKTYWRYVWPGALLASFFFEIARTLFIFYLEHFANYRLIYGSIASIIILLVWIYYSAFIMILGAEFTFQYGRLRNPVTVWSSTDE